MSVSYTRINFLDRVVQHSKAYIETENADETIDHTPAPGEIYQQGTKLNANIMNILDKGIDDCAKAINEMGELDNAPTSGSNKAVKSGGIYNALAGKKNTQTAKSSPSASGNALAFIDTITQNAQGVITATKKNVTVDSSPASGSNNPISSGGVHNALNGKQNTLTFDNTPTANSNNPVTSGGIKTALDNKVKMFTATIPSTGWTSQSSGAYYTINLTVSGILATDKPDISIVQTGTWATDEAIRDAWACITRIVTAANKLTITADSIPSRAIPIQVRCIR